ncbi:IQ domain-containing protein D-like [Arapaima gigas]
MHLSVHNSHKPELHETEERVSGSSDTHCFWNSSVASGQFRASVLVSTSELRVFKMDLFPIHEPRQKKLTSLEMQCIASVLDECIRKVETVSLLPTLLANLETQKAALGNELVVALQEHQQLSEKLTGEQQPKIRAEERKTLEEEFQNSLRNILQYLQVNPRANEAVQSWVLSQVSQQLVQGLKDLQGLLVEKLLTSPAEERERSRRVQETTLRHKDNTELISSLEAEVAAAVKDRDIKISTKNDIIRNLKSSLNQMERICEEFVLRTEQDADKQSLSDRKASEARQMRLQEEAKALRVQLNNLVAANRDLEMALRKRKYKVETEIDNWIQKYDTDMDEKQKEQLCELEERYSILVVEYTQIVEEKRLARERKEREERELAVQGRAALVIQAFWRGYKVRKAMKSKSKAKKKKKGKG